MAEDKDLVDIIDDLLVKENLKGTMLVTPQRMNFHF